MENLPPHIALLFKNSNFSKQDSVAVAKHLNFIALKKGEHFCRAGKICDRLGILIEGLLYANFKTSSGKPNVSRFFYYPNNFIVTSFESFKYQKYTNETITAIEPSQILYFTNKGLNELSETVPAINKVIRDIAEDSYILAMQRIHDLQALNMKERIEKFFSNNRTLYNKVNKIQIASYLRVNRNDLTKTVNQIERK